MRCKIPSLGRIWPEKLYRSLVVGVNFMSSKSVCAKYLDMIFTPIAGFQRASKEV
jgi:hypothetical protein